MKKFFVSVILACFFFNAVAQKLQSPSEFLGYKLGDQFTYHYRIVDYFRYIAQNSKNVKLQQYGTTNEGRPLLAAFVASDENVNRLEDIRHNNLRLTGIEGGNADANNPVIVWLSYNVHGNEPSSSEAAMLTLYELVNPDNAQTQKWLANTLVVIDPCLNPDGRDRYVNFYNPVRSLAPDVNPSSREHMEPWPGGRVNHYYFDLNRDWAWQTQMESKARLGLYNQWLPQIHVDYHEQGYNSPYYFAPAAEPFHRDITLWQKEFQTLIGRNNAKYFDRNGWLYFTKQEFDLLYPSYGDTYPLYNGSIGMTYEQGGIRGGLAVLTVDGDTLTLDDRIAHHYTTGLSTIEMASGNAPKLLSEFKKFYDSSRSNPPGEFKGYVVKNDNMDKVALLAKLLDKNGIQYGYGSAATNVKGYDYFSGINEGVKIGPTDMVIDAHQPKAVLLNVLFEPKTFIADSNTYDITAWALPYAYGLKTYGLKQSIKPTDKQMPLHAVNTEVNTDAYAYVCAWKSMADVQFLAALLKQDVKVRYSETAFESGGKKFDAGSLIIARNGNRRSDFDRIIWQTARKFGRELAALSSGFVDKGADLGSSLIRYISKPSIMLVAGDGVSSGSMGEVWQLFEQQIGYPVTIVRSQDLGRIKWSDFDVAIFPDGSYDQVPVDKLQGWVRDGGKLIAMESAINDLVDKKGFSIKQKETKKDDKADKKSASIKIYEARDRDALKSSIPGAIYKVTIDNTHPLGFGLTKTYYTLKLSDQVYDYLGDDGWNVGTIKKDAYVSGFVGQKTREKLNEGLLFGAQSSGRGTIIYLADDPLFRSFWENGKLLFSNAVFMAGQ
ncbi:M14 metallopeptidase family protein [Mucilaginibacter paludis]|uniref:Peptidase M14 carboxypeptidase A n=1 Tax=Mucilaginibacter paludis DSM 18603 TaxID=714943 RepID=H1YIT8_9SPHI|nr:M14 metallopeptidase family protein [Mucilaginibacter paludis]EHQ27633.1 peptidase M14 carboxypeptidase A [Mucilaginibacter paludis DSM 18603]